MKKNEIEFSYKQYSENSILIEGPSVVSEILLDLLMLYKKSIEKEYDKVIIEVISGYNSLLIYYTDTIEDIYSRISELKSLYLKDFSAVSSKKCVWEIPVCYSSKLSPELEIFAASKSLSIEQIITLHTTPLYTVFFIGFLPGFLYLGGLHKKLHTPRKRNPDLKVEKGSVAIGGSQTGIYPTESPGGWHVIGKSPLSFFNPVNNKCCFVSPGDKVKFISIREKEYNDISMLVRRGLFFPKSVEL